MQESQLKEVRNAGEAHKNRDVERQIRPIETLSVEESRTIIDEFCTILIDYFGALAGFHKSQEEYNNHLITIQGPALIGIGENVNITSISSSPNGVSLRNLKNNYLTQWRSWLPSRLDCYYNICNH